MWAAHSAGKTCFRDAGIGRNSYSAVKAQRLARPIAAIGRISGKIEHPYDEAPRSVGIDPGTVEWLEALFSERLTYLLLAENIQAGGRMPGAND